MDSQGGDAGAALIVAHGQPSDPAPAEAELAVLAAAVAHILPGRTVLSATLADTDALARVVAAAAGRRLVVYPMFMADGWFTSTRLPDLLARAGGGRMEQLAPFGLDPAVQALAVTLAHETGAPEVLLAAHGSLRSAAPSAVARKVAGLIAAEGRVARVEAAFIDQSPQIADVARTMGPGAVCLPYFAARRGHVIEDLPQALAAAGFAGRLLPPVGLDARVPGLIAAALLAAF